VWLALGIDFLLFVNEESAAHAERSMEIHRFSREPRPSVAPLRSLGLHEMQASIVNNILLQTKLP